MMDRQKRQTQYYADTERFKPSPELLKIQDLMPITPEDRERLKKDIAESGEIRDPLKVYYSEDHKYLLILGGLNRLEIARELKKERDLDIIIPYEVYELEPIQRERLVIDDNLNRRQLSRDQKTNLINYFLKADPAESDRAIAIKTGTDHKTVSKQRSIKESGGEIPQVEKTKGRDNKTYKRPGKLIPDKPPKQFDFEKYLLVNGSKLRKDIRNFLLNADLGKYPKPIKNIDDARRELIKYIKEIKL
jgi:hypothetical protein